MPEHRVRGVGLHGDAPKRLSLSDGSRLSLDPESGRHGNVSWKRLGWRRRDGSNELSVGEAREVAGGPFARYVETRTRSEAEWMRAVGDWYHDQANRLAAQLRG